MTVENRTLSQLRDAAEQRAEDAEYRAEEFKDQIRAIEFERNTMRADAVSARQQCSALEAAARTAKDIRALPMNLQDVIVLIGALHGDRIVFTNEAIQSSKSAAIDEASNGVDVAWKLLHSMATVLHDLAFGDTEAGDICAQFRTASGGFEMSMSEGKLTKANARLVSSRIVTYDGKDWDITPHAKSDKPKYLRVHFALDHDKRRVIVGHCGDHLETAGTRRNG